MYYIPNRSHLIPGTYINIFTSTNLNEASGSISEIGRFSTASRNGSLSSPSSRTLLQCKYMKSILLTLYVHNKTHFCSIYLNGILSTEARIGAAIGSWCGTVSTAFRANVKLERGDARAYAHNANAKAHWKYNENNIIISIYYKKIIKTSILNEAPK